jgi:hypothetical protein
MSRSLIEISNLVVNLTPRPFSRIKRTLMPSGKRQPASLMGSA